MNKFFIALILYVTIGFSLAVITIPKNRPDTLRTIECVIMTKSYTFKKGKHSKPYFIIGAKNTHGVFIFKSFEVEQFINVNNGQTVICDIDVMEATNCVPHQEYLIIKEQYDMYNKQHEFSMNIFLWSAIPVLFILVTLLIICIGRSEWERMECNK